MYSEFANSPSTSVAAIIFINTLSSIICERFSSFQTKWSTSLSEATLFRIEVRRSYRIEIMPSRHIYNLTSTEYCVYIEVKHIHCQFQLSCHSVAEDIPISILNREIWNIEIETTIFYDSCNKMPTKYYVIVKSNLYTTNIRYGILL
jgi:hypothetical protein